MALRPRDFESEYSTKKDVGRNRRQTERAGESKKAGSPVLYLFGVGRQGLLHNLLHSRPAGGGGPVPVLGASIHSFGLSTHARHFL